MTPLPLPLDGGIFDTIGGIAAHPLFVHAAVVLIPLTSLAVIATVVIARWRARYGTLTLLGLAVATVAGFFAMESGESLLRNANVPVDHQFWGKVVPFLALGLTALYGAFWAFTRPPEAASRAAARRSPVSLLAGGLAAVLAVAILALTMLVGHSGATAVWGTPAPTTATASPSASATTSASASASSSTPIVTASAAPTTTVGPLTLATVATHNSATSCWSVVSSNVYDLTAWISLHPGGSSRILQMCGVDATAAFSAQHGNSQRAKGVLASYLLGPLAA